MRRTLRAIPIAMALAVMLSACRFEGINSLPLPFSAGTGSDSYTITVSMADVGNLVPHSEVKVNDLTVGTVTAIRFRDWQALLTVGLEPEAQLSTQTTAKVGQKSLLGAEYLELAPGPQSNRDDALLGPGSHIPLSHTGRFPETEETLAAASLFLNGGGLGQLQTIVAELNNALAGREPDVRSSFARLKTFASGLEQQRSAIERTIDSVDRLAGTLAQGNETLDTAVHRIGPGVEVLATQRPNLTSTFKALARLSDTVNRVVDTSGQNLTSSLRALQPVVRELVNSGDDLPQSLKYLTVPFSLDYVPRMFRGDYANAFLTLDLTTKTLTNNFLGNTALGPLFEGLQQGQPNSNPLELPFVPSNVGGDAGPPHAGARPDTVPPTPSSNENKDTTASSRPRQPAVPGEGTLGSLFPGVG